MREFTTPSWRGGLPVLLVLVLGAPLAHAGELPAALLAAPAADLIRAIPQADGSVVTLGASGIDHVQLGREATRLAETTEGQTLVLADDGQFYGQIAHRQGAADFSPAESFELRTLTGELRWRLGPTEDVTFAISGDGTLVAGMEVNINVPERNRLHLYGEGGRLLADIAVPYLTGGRFDPPGQSFLAQSRDGLTALDPSGTELWRVPGARLFAASADGRRVAVVGAAGLTIVQDGAVIHTLPLEDPLVRRVAIAENGNRVALAWKHQVRVYDRGLTPVFGVSLEDALSWTSVAFGGDGPMLLAGCARDAGPSVPEDRRHPTGEVRIYDAGGALRHHTPLRFSSWNIWSPSAELDRSGQRVLITSRRALYQVVLP